ncbi:MAG: ATP-binding protein [Solidesulfovibrio sp. DCME]|uniref:sensor histidine kinase n=1 Tax=Solidesulfovibrio sp. DCME TaxID=3447380 RepID=UPI003D0DE494
MDDAARIAFLTARVESLSREKEEALAALAAAAGLGHFDTSYSRLESPQPILAEIAGRVRDLLPLEAVALFLVDEASHDMVLSLALGQAPGFDPEAELDSLIDDHSLALVLDQPGPAFFRARGRDGRLAVHRLATPSRVRGVCLGLLRQGSQEATDQALALFTVVLNAGAAALESYFLYRHLSAANQGLERKVAERTAALRRAYDEVRVIIDSLPAGVAVIDPASHAVVDINPAGAAMVGRGWEELVGRECFDCFCPAQRGNCPIIDGGQTLSCVERRIRDATGREILILKTAVRASLAGRDCVIESFVDISEQKKLESLREDVERMTRHDLKAPLTGIIGLPDVLMDDPDLPGHVRPLLGMIKESGLKMLGMINLSLDLYKMEAGTYVLDPRPVDLCRVLESVAGDLAPLTRAKAVAIRFETDGASGLAGPVTVLGEELLFFSLFANLLKNAVEASPRDGEVAVAVLGRDMVLVSLHNAGAVPEAIRDRFFEKYATSGKAGGTGLGAYSARLIVESLGGTISCVSDEAAGTTLCCMLPRPAGASVRP